MQVRVLRCAQDDNICRGFQRKGSGNCKVQRNGNCKVQRNGKGKGKSGFFA